MAGQPPFNHVNHAPSKEVGRYIQMSDKALIHIEQKEIELYDDNVIAVRMEDGEMGHSMCRFDHCVS